MPPIRLVKVSKSRNVNHNVPVLAGTRIPVRAIQRFAEDGYTVEQILVEYPSLTAKDVKAAIAHGPDQGGLSRRRH